MLPRFHIFTSKNYTLDLSMIFVGLKSGVSLTKHSILLIRNINIHPLCKWFTCITYLTWYPANRLPRAWTSSSLACSLEKDWNCKRVSVTIDYRTWFFIDHPFMGLLIHKYWCIGTNDFELPEIYQQLFLLPKHIS